MAFVARRLRMTVGLKIYALVGLGFLGLLGITFLDSRELVSSLTLQKQVELRHLTDMAIGMIKEEQAAVKAGGRTIAEAQQRALARLEALRYAGNEYFFILDTQTRLLMHPLQPKLVGRDLSDFRDSSGDLHYKIIVDAARVGDGVVRYNQNRPGVAEPQPKLSYVASFVPWGWVIVTGVYIDDLDAQAWISIQHSLLGAGFVLVLTLVVSTLMARGITKPLNRMTIAMKDLAVGKLDIEVPGIGRRDEVGEMADALLIFKEQAVEKSRLLALQEAERQQAIDTRKQTMQDMAGVVERETTTAVNAVGDTAGDVRTAAEEMSQFAAAVSVDTQSVASASEQALASAQTVSSAAEQLNASIQEINAQVSHTADVARQAVASGDIATSTVRSLTDAIVKISDVTKLIGDIASQTNLLALNATIEAARAGEAGRGFAVVASEVKNLAAQTARSTEDINRQVAEIQLVSGSAVGAMADVGARIGEINQSTEAMLTAIKQQSAATQEITRNVGETALSAREVSARIQNVSAGAAKVGSQADNVRRSIGEITENIAGLRAVLVRVVRTSTDDTNRRKYPRYPLAVQAEILDGSGKRLIGELVDISEAGAQLSCSSGMRSGEKGSLNLDGLRLPLPFVVRARQGEALHVEFELNEVQRSIFRQWFDQRLASTQALAS